MRVAYPPSGNSATPRPGKILGVGRNYREHAAELNNAVPTEPLLFFKPPSAIVPSGAPIVRPRPASGDWRVDFEGELGVVIGKTCRRVSKKDAMSYVAGYTIVNDVTVRDLQKKDGQFTRAKGFDSFCPCGPFLVDDIDPSTLHIVTKLDGVVKQDGWTRDMIFDIPTIIEVASRVMTLEPGDLISTGTPSGVAPILPGMTVEITIEGIGTLVNSVVEESAS